MPQALLPGCQRPLAHLQHITDSHKAGLALAHDHGAHVLRGRWCGVGATGQATSLGYTLALAFQLNQRNQRWHRAVWVP